MAPQFDRLWVILTLVYLAVAGIPSIYPRMHGQIVARGMLGLLTGRRILRAVMGSLRVDVRRRWRPLRDLGSQLTRGRQRSTSGGDSPKSDSSPDGAGAGPRPTVRACNCCSRSRMRSWRRWCSAFHSCATVLEIGKLAAQRPDVRRFRPDIVIGSHRSLPFEEDEWVGGVLLFGEGVEAAAIGVTMRDELCATVNLDPDSAHPTAEMLRAIVRAKDNKTGLWHDHSMRAPRGGTIRTLRACGTASVAHVNRLESCLLPGGERELPFSSPPSARSSLTDVSRRAADGN